MNKNKLNRLDEMMQSQVDSGMIPGGHLRIIKDGERVYDKCFGMADVARNLKVSDNTIYRLYSNSHTTSQDLLFGFWPRFLSQSNILCEKARNALRCKAFQIYARKKSKIRTRC